MPRRFKLNLASFFACQDPDDEILSGEEKQAFVYDTPGKVSGASVSIREGPIRLL